ncbi:hypothetical protein ORV05_04980 [Amycolatopsis cynarae]|uniref:Uncharacterized protein n=1 Tax=Amycolatopsis cynarae TaxID=2995223 RepID=A0ABY7B4N4_9PSEU|nr:hypothetical protein [Amycolatopsis sp. HUAS 11-8]WAL67146.1 hypothetical protein ORV05_04980 [Amycolatopsis sp. HUAS 11-8]
MRGRYTGTLPVAFEAPVGAQGLGDEFDLPPGRETAFLQHGHVEPADEEAQAFYAAMTEPEPEPEPEPAKKNPPRKGTQAK